MNLNDLVKEFDLEVKTGANHLDREVTSGYVSDLLSDVLAHADEGTLWVTLHIHQNIVAVASHKDLGGYHPGAGTGSRKRTPSPRPRKRTSRSW